MKRHVVRKKKKTPSARCPTPGEGASKVFSGTRQQHAALRGSSGRLAAEQGTRSVSAASFGGHLPRSPPCRGPGGSHTLPPAHTCPLQGAISMSPLCPGHRAWLRGGLKFSSSEGSLGTPHPAPPPPAGEEHGLSPLNLGCWEDAQRGAWAAISAPDQ